MLNKIITYSIRNKLIVILFLITLLFYGGYQVTQLPIDAVPDITNNQVQVITLAPSFGATDIERLVTFPIEQANSNIPGTIEIRSFSRFGLSMVTIVFKDDVDIYWARQQVSERLQKVRSLIPANIGQPELGPVTTGLGEIYQYVVKPKKGYEQKYSITELRSIQDWVIRRQLLGVKGVAEVSSFGGKLKQYEVAIDPSKLKSYNLNINDIFTALEKNNQNTGGTYIEKGPTVLYIRSEGLLNNSDDIANILIRTLENGTPLLIRNVAEVRTGSATRYGALCYNDEGEVAGAIVMMLKGANSNEVIKNVKEKISSLEKTLPEGIIIEPFLDRTKMVNHAIGTVERNLIEGALIVVFVLVLFLGNFRAGLLVASVIPLAMLFAVIMMNTFGVSGNLMSLGALDFGLIVDGAVIIVEGVMHGLSLNKKYSSLSKLNQLQMDEEVNSTAGKMMNSAVFGQIIILAVYLPIFSLQGIEGKMFKPMAQTVAFALVGAFLLSLTYIPVMSALLISKETKHKKNISSRMMEWLERKYRALLSRILHAPRALIISVISLFICSLIALSFLGGEFIPTLEEGDFALETRALTGTNLNTMISTTTKAAHILKTRFPEVIKVVTKIGSGEVPTDPMPMDAADIIIILKDKSEWTSATSFNELAEKMNEALNDCPGLTYSFQFPVQMRFNELMTGAKQDVVCKIFGDDLDTLALYADKLGKIIGTIEGAKDIYIEAIKGMPQIIINYKRNAMAEYGLAIEDVNRIINSAFAGQASGLIFEGEKRFDLVVRLDTARRKTIEDVQNLLIPSSKGSQIPLYQVADVTIKDGPNQVQREQAKRRIIVGFNVRGRDVQTIVNELQQKVNKQIKFPSGYYPEYGGAFENLNSAKKRLSIAVPVSLLLIFLLLYFTFNSVRQGLLIYSAIPLSAIGGIFALTIRGMPFSISAGIGFIALFGVAVLNGIVLIAEFNYLKKSGMTDLPDLILTGSGTRLRPVLMTACVASFGFLPMALSNGAGAEVQRPLATVVIGGLLVATLLTLFVLPVLYMLIEKRKFKIKTANVVLLSLLLLTAKSYSQTPISLQAAIDTALKNNLAVKSERLKAEYRKQLVKSSANIQQTSITGEYGQINSAYYDNRFTVGQNFSFPLVYARQKQVLNEEWKSSLLTVALKEAELKRNVTFTFYHFQSLKQKEKLLLFNDSIFSDALNRIQIRLDKGEIDILEKTVAETQRGSIFIQLKDLRDELDLVKMQFHLILNSITDFYPEEKERRMNEPSNTNLAAVEHPYLRQLAQQQKLAESEIKLEKSRFLPEIMLQYNNMTIKGYGADNIFYYGSSRFQSALVGIGVPLFFNSTKAKINAAKINKTVSETNFQDGLAGFQTELTKLLNRFKSNKEILNYFETKGLTNATILLETANKQFKAGQLNHLNWLLLIDQATIIKNDYINALKNY
ncbi:MAG: CusA/CzcA family heavy metal efflux RND transporter, partial [Bacteroidia bacterium]